MKNFPALCLAVFCIAAPSRLHSQEQGPRELFAQAYSLYSTGRLPEAEDLFRKTLDNKFLLADYSLYFLGVISSSRGRLDESRRYFTRLKASFPQSLWSARADLELARLSLAEADYQEAIAGLKTLRTRKTKQGISQEALYLLGSIRELLGELPEAYSAYQELRRDSPLSPWGARARGEVRRLREQYPRLFNLDTVQALSDEGELSFQERQYPDAEKAYRKLLDLVPAGPLRPRFLLALGNVLRAERKREEAIPVLTRIADRYPSSPEGPAALYRLAEIYWNRDDNEKALASFERVRERYPKSPFTPSAYLAAGRICESLEKPDAALALYRELAKRFPESPAREEARWASAWIHYLKRDYERAGASFHRLAADKGNGRYKIAATYWEARTAQHLGQADRAKELLLRILGADEESYYKGPAARELERMGVALPERKTKAVDPLPEAAPPPSPESSFHLARAGELGQMSLNQLAVAELDAVQDSISEDLPMKLTVMREYARDEAYARSVAMANRISSSSDELDRYRYPLAFWKTIRKLAAQRGLDPYLVLALVRQESVFDPTALSRSSAFGLMQLLPSTAARAAADLRLAHPEPAALYQPELNLALGTHYLKELLRRYANDPVKAIAAYNAGENAVDRWQKQIPAEDSEVFIERIPYRETRLYVKLVLRNRRVYRELYEVAKEKNSSD